MNNTVLLDQADMDRVNDALPANLRMADPETRYAAIDAATRGAVDNELSKLGINPQLNTPRAEVVGNPIANLVHGYEAVSGNHVEASRYVRQHSGALHALFYSTARVEYDASLTELGAVYGVNFPGINIPAGLQRQVFMDKVLIAFKRALLPLVAFSTRFNNVALEGTDKLEVAFVSLTTAASKDMDKAVGYDLTGAASMDVREVTINKRKYQPLVWTSQDRRRQPNLSPDQLATQISQKLACDVLLDIFSIITVANFGIAPLMAFDAFYFDEDALMDLKDVCDKAFWPEKDRGLVLDSSYANRLVRDPRILMAANYGSAGGVATGSRDQVAGFTPYPVPAFPTNGEQLCGFAAFPSAILVGFSPIRPTEEVRHLLSDYQLASDPDSGLTIEYRRGGDMLLDKSFELIEANYGYAKGQEEALKRIVKP